MCERFPPFTATSGVTCLHTNRAVRSTEALRTGEEVMSDKAKAGTLICVDQGCYSDYGVSGFFVVLRDFTPKTELDEYLSSRKEQQEDYAFREGEFLAALLAKGY